MLISAPGKPELVSISAMPCASHFCTLGITCTAGTIDTKREGLGGGFKELDEAELEEARKRRKEYEDKDMWVACGAEGQRFSRAPQRHKGLFRHEGLSGRKRC